MTTSVQHNLFGGLDRVDADRTGQVRAVTPLPDSPSMPPGLPSMPPDLPSDLAPEVPGSPSAEAVLRESFDSLRDALRKQDIELTVHGALEPEHFKLTLAFAGRNLELGPVTMRDAVLYLSLVAFGAAAGIKAGSSLTNLVR